MKYNTMFVCAMALVSTACGAHFFGPSHPGDISTDSPDPQVFLPPAEGNAQAEKKNQREAEVQATLEATAPKQQPAPVAEKLFVEEKVAEKPSCSELPKGDAIFVGNGEEVKVALKYSTYSLLVRKDHVTVITVDEKALYPSPDVSIASLCDADRAKVANAAPGTFAVPGGFELVSDIVARREAQAAQQREALKSSACQSNCPYQQ